MDGIDRIVHEAINPESTAYRFEAGHCVCGTKLPAEDHDVKTVAGFRWTGCPWMRSGVILAGYRSATVAAWRNREAPE